MLKIVIVFLLVMVGIAVVAGPGFRRLIARWLGLPVPPLPSARISRISRRRDNR
ncbi:hypothetical protein [Paracoccus pacificus]|uniref:Uncharacterized protein n=1 Tax=Paracoccus pacificus TaxID=1463598 RepID=A0ABW4RA26_9RHOB